MLADDIMKAQVYETVEQHLKKERALKGKGIKVLSLFFIDRVANYRIYNEDGTTSLGKIGMWFEEAYKELTAKPMYKGLDPFRLLRKSMTAIFRRTSRATRKIRAAIRPMMRTPTISLCATRRRLLDPECRRYASSSRIPRCAKAGIIPTSSRFARSMKRSRLRKSDRRSAAAFACRSIRAGERVHDETVNRLTVIANESYEDFARTLQTEFEEDFGIQFGKVEKIAFAKFVRRARRNRNPIRAGRLGKSGTSSSRTAISTPTATFSRKFDPKNPHFELKLPMNSRICGPRSSTRSTARSSRTASSMRATDAS